jgi:hypothetical protein
VVRRSGVSTCLPRRGDWNMVAICTAADAAVDAVEFSSQKNLAFKSGRRYAAPSSWLRD